MQDGSNKKILVVEDNELNLKLFRDLLETHGHEVIETKDGNESLLLVSQVRPDLVLMDIQLQGISGFDVIKQIKADPSLRHIPVIAVTAFAMEDDREKIMQSGCEAYIPKPISIGPFLNMVNGFLNQGVVHYAPTPLATAAQTSTESAT